MTLLVWLGSGFAAWLFVCVPSWVFLFCAGRSSEVRRVAIRLAPVGAFYCVYAWLVHWTQKASVVGLAERNSVGIADTERRWHVFVEPWLSAHSVPGAVVFYDWAQLFVVVGVLSYLAVGEGEVFWRVARNALALVAAGGFLVYWLVPVAPPWLLPASYGVHSGGLRSLAGVGDLLGAMPSLHTAWAGWVALVLWVVVPGRLRWLAVANLVVTMYVVLATGNHFVVDVVAGELLAYSACRASSWISLRFGLGGSLEGRARVRAQAVVAS